MKKTFTLARPFRMRRRQDTPEILLGTGLQNVFRQQEFGSNEFAVPGLDIESGAADMTG